MIVYLPFYAYEPEEPGVQEKKKKKFSFFAEGRDSGGLQFNVISKNSIQVKVSNSKLF